MSAAEKKKLKSAVNFLSDYITCDELLCLPKVCEKRRNWR